MKVRTVGWTGVLCEVESQAAVHDLVERLRVNAAEGSRPDLRDIVPGARTVLLTTAAATDVGPVLNWLAAVNSAGDTTVKTTQHHVEPVEIAVRYDGEDLHEVAAQLGIHPDEVVELHTGADYVVAFCGFSPGWAYIEGLPEELYVPRRSRPRPAVPAGSVAVAGPYTGVFPRVSPSGWNLLGTTDQVLWNLDDDPPALLTTGRHVRFRAR